MYGVVLSFVVRGVGLNVVMFGIICKTSDLCHKERL